MDRVDSREDGVLWTMCATWQIHWPKRVIVYCSMIEETAENQIFTWLENCLNRRYGQTMYMRC